MTDGERFHAPWGRALTFTTALCLLLLVGIAILGLLTRPRDLLLWKLGMIVMPLSMLLIAPFFAIRGYVLDADSIRVLRPGWKTTVKLAGLRSATRNADAMSRSIRTLGNGGLFCIAGVFHNNTLGTYRAFATDPARAVVLKFQDRTVVLTPDRPDEFVAKIRAMHAI